MLVLGIKLELQVDQLMESHSDPDLVVFYHFIEIPELNLIEG